MDSKAVQSVSRQVYRKFPEMTGIKPKVRTRPVSSTAASASRPVHSTAPTYLLTFQTKAELGSGKSLSRWVRVVADAKGNILKLSTSR